MTFTASGTTPSTLNQTRREALGSERRATEWQCVHGTIVAEVLDAAPANCAFNFEEIQKGSFERANKRMPTVFRWPLTPNTSSDMKNSAT
jgi:hypothetical protein